MPIPPVAPPVARPIPPVAPPVAPTVVPVPQEADAMLTGHFASWSVEPRVPRPTANMLGFTQFVRILNFFERPIGNGEHYGLNGQWIQDPAAGGGKPWGSIEGGIFVSRKLGLSRLPKYHIAASTHRYDKFSDTAGGWGFYEVPIPAECLARVIIANAFVLPPSGLSFEAGGADDARMFGAGWIATALFGADAQSGKAPLTWMFFAEAENFAGPVCCYPPQMFTRRIAGWSAFRRKEDASLGEDYLTVRARDTLAYSGPIASSASAGGEFPNIEAVFAREGGWWKIPQITLPSRQKKNVWASHFGLYFDGNYERTRAALADPTGAALAQFQLLAETDVTCSVSHSAELGVKTVRDAKGMPAYNGVEVDHRIRMPLTVRAESGSGRPSVVYEWDANTELDRSRALTRYVRTTTDRADVVVNGNGESFQRMWCDFVAEDAAPSAMRALEYESEERPGPKEYRSRAGESAFSTHDRSECGGAVCTLKLEDGAVVSYRWYRFVEQPALVQLTKEFPHVFTVTELARLQAAVVRMHTHWGAATTRTRSFLNHDYATLVSIERALFVARPRVGYVPVAVGLEYPARAPNGVPAERSRW
jgi:hypothetical protein